jgi:hypothetical protein
LTNPETTDHINKIYYLLMKTNLLIGAISANYSVKDIENWVKTSNFEDTDRVLYLYNGDESSPLVPYLAENNIDVYIACYNFFTETQYEFLTDTGKVSPETSYNLVHNIRFLHIANFLRGTGYEKVFITDVKDVMFTQSPFPKVPKEGIIATGEVIKYKEHAWNLEHLHITLGAVGLDLIEEEVLNVGVFGGGREDVEALCKDIYLMSCGKFKVADQTSFNFLTRNSYKHKTVFTTLEDKFAIHLHVVKEGAVKFNLNNLKDYTIIHQYDRFGDEILNYYTIPE